MKALRRLRSANSWEWEASCALLRSTKACFQTQQQHDQCGACTRNAHLASLKLWGEQVVLAPVDMCGTYNNKY
eukprot:1133671-Pelagomonas_calceolata.AAC.20